MVHTVCLFAARPCLVLKNLPAHDLLLGFEAAALTTLSPKQNTK
jgi:hypothetical protein